VYSGRVQVAGILLGGGKSERFGSPKLEAEIGGRRLLDIACTNFLGAGFSPVVFCGRTHPADPRVIVTEPGAEMIDTLRSGLGACPRAPFAFAPADMPALSPELLLPLIEAFRECGKPFLLPVHAGRRGHPAFARLREPFLTARLASDVWRSADLAFHVVASADVLFDVDAPEDLAAAGDALSRRARLVARGDLRG